MDIDGYERVVNALDAFGLSGNSAKAVRVTKPKDGASIRAVTITPKNPTNTDAADIINALDAAGLSDRMANMTPSLRPNHYFENGAVLFFDLHYIPSFPQTEA